MYSGPIPFDKESGDMVSWTYGDDQTVEWRPNTVFSAAMTLVDMERGRSAARFIVKDDAGHSYYLFMKDFMELLQKHSMQAGRTPPLKWQYCKRGTNYGVQVAE